MEIPTLAEIAERLPEKLARHMLYSEGTFCPLGFILHELGVPTEAMDQRGSSLRLSDAPLELRRTGDQHDSIIDVPSLLSRAYPAVRDSQFLNLMALNDLNLYSKSRVKMAREALLDLERDGQVRPWTQYPGGAVRWTQ